MNRHPTSRVTRGHALNASRPEHARCLASSMGTKTDSHRDAGMGAKSSGGPGGGNPTPRRQGRREGVGGVRAREGASGGSLRCDAESNTSEALMRRVLRGELASSSEARYPLRRMRRGDGFASKFRVPYPGRSVGLHESSGSWK
jgi:hypothetical protein